MADQGGSPRLYPCKYCVKKFVKYQALGGHLGLGEHKRQKLEEEAAARQKLEEEEAAARQKLEEEAAAAKAAINMATARAMAITTATESLNIHQLTTPSNPPGASTSDFSIRTATNTLKYQFDLNFPPTEIPEFEFDLNHPPRD